MKIICPDCGKFDAYNGRCPKCGGLSWVPAGGIGDKVGPLPWLRRLRAVKAVASRQRRMPGLQAFWRNR